MGMFDDLIPNSPTNGMFGDLIPTSPNKVASQPKMQDRIAPEVTDPRQSFGGGFLNAVTGGFGPELSGALNYLKTGGAPGAYEQGKAELEKKLGVAQEDNPGMYTAGDVLGTGTALAAPGGPVMRGATGLPSIALRSGALSGLYGAYRGAGEAEGDLADRATAAAKGAVTEGVTGAALPVVGKGVAAGVRAVTGKYVAPTAKAFATAAKEGYDQFDDLARDVIFQPGGIRKFIGGLRASAAEAGADQHLTPNTFRAFKETERKLGDLVGEAPAEWQTKWNAFTGQAPATGTAPTVPDLTTMREIRSYFQKAADDAMRSRNANDRRLATGMIQAWDEAIDHLPTMEGSLPVKDVMDIRRSADKFFHQSKQAETIEALQKGRGGAQAAAQRYTATPIGKKNMYPARRQFGPEIGRMIEDVGEGTTTQNVLRKTGDLAYKATVPLSLAAMMLPVGGAPVIGGLLATGAATKALARGLARRNLNQISAMVRGGGKIPVQDYTRAQAVARLLTAPVIESEEERNRNGY